jgi:predicted peptidase
MSYQGGSEMPVFNFSLHLEVPERKRINYQLFLPYGYEAQRDKKYPLIVFLHGNKKCGDDITLLNNYGLTWIAEGKADFQFIVVTPQCPADSDWTSESDTVITVTKEIISTYRVNWEDIYLTGFSMGGRGAWDLAAKYPDFFSAVVPISGRFEVEKAHLLKDMPIWAFHGEEDDVVPSSGSEDMFKALRSLGGNIRFTSYPGLKHFVMDETFGNPELYEWLLTHKRRFL